MKFSQKLKSNIVSKDTALNYCENSSIHGMKYISYDKSRSLVEQLTWITLLIISFCSSAYFIARIYTKRCESPVIVSFNEAPVPIWQIPFPAVTICPETKTKRDVFKYAETLLNINNSWHNVTEKQLNYFNTIEQLCADSDHHNFDSEIKVDPYNSNYIKIIQELAPKFNETLHNCIFRSEEIKCKNVFSPIITDVGLCFTYNALPGEEIYRTSELSEDFFLYKPLNKSFHWNVDNGYSDINVQTSPTRGLMAGIKSGLVTILMSRKADFDYLCRSVTQGFLVILHSPAEIPHTLGEYHKIQVGSDINIKVQPKLTMTTASLINIPSAKRGCFFSHERHLKFFQIYTKDNCRIECITNATLSKCGCAKFHMPRNQMTRICNANDINCYINAEYYILEKEIEEQLEADDANVKCNCLPLCNTLEYDADVTDVLFEVQDLAKLYPKSEEMLKNYSFAKLNIFFKTATVDANKRSELYTNTDFIANCGGLLGMFMGASLLSIVEIIYFCILRLIVTLRVIPTKDKGVISVKPANTKSLNE